MRILVIGDIHGNLPALEMLLKQEHKGYDELICHGDVVNYGPWSNECVELLASISNAVLLKGNHEDNYITGEYTGQHPVARAFFDFCFPRFDPSLKETIKQYGSNLRRGSYLIQHTIDQRYIFADTDLSQIRIDNDYIIGHSHQSFIRMEKNHKIVNTGSLGQNREFINLSSYAILDTADNSVVLKSFVSDIDRVLDKMRSDGYPKICLDYYMGKKRV